MEPNRYYSNGGEHSDTVITVGTGIGEPNSNAREVACISLCANVLRKGINLSGLHLKLQVNIKDKLGNRSWRRKTPNSNKF